MGRKMRSYEDLRMDFVQYLIMYGPDEANVGIKGIRSDAPEDAKEKFFLWYRDRHRYDSGRMMNKDDPRLKLLIIDVSECKQDEIEENILCSEHATMRYSIA